AGSRFRVRPWIRAICRVIAGQTVSHRVKMKLATHTRPARSFEPKGLPSCAVSSNGGKVPRTFSRGGMGVRSAHTIGQAAMNATRSAQATGRATTSLTARWKRSRKAAGLAVDTVPGVERRAGMRGDSVLRREQARDGQVCKCVTCTVALAHQETIA